MNFKQLHQQTAPVLICNVWDVASAKAAQKLNFQAIGTSNGAIAAKQIQQNKSFKNLFT